MVRHPLPGADLYSKESWPRTAYIPQHENSYVPTTAPATAPVLTVPIPTALPQTIENTLKGCGLSIKAYALIIRTENGEEKVYSSPSLASVREKIFTDAFKSTFRKHVKRATATLVDNRIPHSGFNLDAGFNDFAAGASNSRRYNRKHSSGESSSEYGHRLHYKIEDSDENGYSSSKKRRFSGYRGNRDCNDDTLIPIKQTQQLLIIGDAAEVEKFYYTRFKDMQQWACKVMGKAFVKLIEPKKQTHHPYTKGDEKKPLWWPDTKGDNHVRHREPDHLLRPERIRLLVHILRMVIRNECEAVKKLDLNVQKLENFTNEQMSNWFNDKEHDNASKRPFLKEIFKIAKAEERFLRGEIDASTSFSVMSGDRSTAYMEESDEEGIEEEDEGGIETPAASLSMSSPGNMVSPTTLHPPQQADAKRLPMRQSQLEERSQYADNSAYYSSRNMHFNPQSTSFGPTASYSSPQQQPMYSNTWGILSGSSVGQSFYVTSPPSLPTSSGPWLPPISQQQHGLPLPALQSFQDSLPRYDTAPALGNTLRTGSIGHPHQHHHQMDTPFENTYLQDNTGYQHHEHEMKEEQNQHLHHSQQ